MMGFWNLLKATEYTSMQLLFKRKLRKVAKNTKKWYHLAPHEYNIV